MSNLIRPCPDLTPEETLALQGFAAQFGRNWKSHLRDMWSGTAREAFDQPAIMRRIRNNFGPSWLASYRLRSELKKERK